jgi:hypothetical protein
MADALAVTQAIIWGWTEGAIQKAAICRLNAPMATFPLMMECATRNAALTPTV